MFLFFYIGSESIAKTAVFLQKYKSALPEIVWFMVNEVGGYLCPDADLYYLDGSLSLSVIFPQGLGRTGRWEQIIDVIVISGHLRVLGVISALYRFTGF